MKCSIYLLLLVTSSIAVVRTADNSENENSGSEISNILGVLTKGFNIHSALKVVKNLKIEASTVKTAFQIFPLYRQIFKELAAQNPDTKIGLDIIEGHIPTIKDLVSLLHISKMNGVVMTLLSQNQQYQQIKTLMRNPDLEISKDDIEQLIFLLFGHHLDLKNAMIQDSTTGKYKLVDSHGNHDWNLVQCVYFIHDNWQILESFFETHDGYAAAALKLIPTFDWSHLSQVRETKFDDPKYSIKGTGGSNPDVVDILHMIKTTTVAAKRGDDYTGTELPFEVSVINKLLHVMSTSIQDAVSTNTQVVG